MNTSTIDAKTQRPALLIALITFVVYFLSNPLSGSYYDYTFRIAGALINGETGLSQQPPEWLNEMIPLNGKYYSSFPLGSVLTMIPVAILKRLKLIDSFPGLFIAALLAAMTSFLLFKLSAKYNDGFDRRLALTIFPVFGTWMWANLAFAGAWHIALGVAVAGQLAALYFVLIKPNPMLAGLFFALAFGNRTEIILLAPIFIFLVYRTPNPQFSRLHAIARFLAIPFALGVATLAYNYARFDSIFDFGYARIPGVLEEPWYRHGIFSIYAIPGNIDAMLLEPWKRVDHFPYLVPTGFGGSIILNSPYLIFLFRRGSRDRTLKIISWLAIGMLTLALWCHGNPGGWQFSYRYASVLLPWMFVILLETSPRKVTVVEMILLIVSIAINAYGTYLFLRTDYISY